MGRSRAHLFLLLLDGEFTLPRKEEEEEEETARRRVSSRSSSLLVQRTDEKDHDCAR